MSAVSFIKDATLCEEHASHNGFLQSLDAKIVALSMQPLPKTESSGVVLVYQLCSKP